MGEVFTSAWITLATPAIWLAALAAAPALCPATSTWTSPPHWAAAVTVLRVAPLMDALSCSAITRDVMNGSCIWLSCRTRSGIHLGSAWIAVHPKDPSGIGPQ